MADSPRAYFRLNESVGAQLVYDEVSNQRMTPASSVTFGVPGPFDVIGNNKAARFDGPTSRIEHADPALVFNANRSFSVELWMQPKVSERYMHAVSQQYEEGGGGNSVLHGWALVINLSEGLFLERFVNGERRSTGAGALTFDQNTTSAHVVGTYDGSSMRLYVGGQLVSQTLDDRAVPKDAMTTSITIGNSVTGAYFEGVIDEVAVYDKALNADAIAAHLAP